MLAHDGAAAAWAVLLACTLARGTTTAMALLPLPPGRVLLPRRPITVGKLVVRGYAAAAKTPAGGGRLDPYAPPSPARLRSGARARDQQPPDLICIHATQTYRTVTRTRVFTAVKIMSESMEMSVKCWAPMLR